MPYYMIFAIDERTTGQSRLATFAAPLTVFHADSGEEACKAAAAKTRSLTMYFAVEGTPWGVNMMQVEGAGELSLDEPEETEQERRLRALERQVLDRDVPLD